MLENLVRLQQMQSGKLGSVTAAFQEAGIEASVDLIIEIIRQRHQQEVDAKMVESVRNFLKE